MNMLATAAGFTLKRSLMPWMIAACAIVLSSVGAAGMYAGYEISNGRHAKAILDLKDAQILALKARSDQYLAAVVRGDEAAGVFMDALRNIKVVNNTITQEVRREIEKTVYTDCKIPESGADLLARKVNAVNLKLVSPVAKDKK